MTPFKTVGEHVTCLSSPLSSFRLCLLPKALALAQLFDMKTCIVVDSGATCSYVWVVLDGKVDDDRTQCMSVGGWHVSQFLRQALTWRDNKDAAGVRRRSRFFCRRTCLQTIDDPSFSIGYCFKPRYILCQTEMSSVPEHRSRGIEIVLEKRDALHKISARLGSQFESLGTDRSNVVLRAVLSP